jgi:lipid A disaccharide synthetase
LPVKSHHDKVVVKELIQDEMTTDNIRNELDLFLNDPAKQEQTAQRLCRPQNTITEGRAMHLPTPRKALLSFGNRIITISVSLEENYLDIIISNASRNIKIDIL